KRPRLIAVCALAPIAIALLGAWTFGQPWLSPNDAARIRVGMARAEVERILGRPADEEWDQSERIPQFHPPGQSRIRLVWEGAPVSVRVIFADDQAEWVYVKWVGEDVWDELRWIVEKTTGR